MYAFTVVPYDVDMYTVHCKMAIVRCTIHTVHCRMYTLYTILQHKLFNTRCTLFYHLYSL